MLLVDETSTLKKSCLKINEHFLLNKCMSLLQYNGKNFLIFMINNFWVFIKQKKERKIPVPSFSLNYFQSKNLNSYYIYLYIILPSENYHGLKKPLNLPYTALYFQVSRNLMTGGLLSQTFGQTALGIRPLYRKS